MAWKKRKVVIIVICIAAMILFTAAITLSIAHKKEAVTGTFCTGDGISQDDLYITLFSDNRFLIYRQFGVVACGNYSCEDHEGFALLTLEQEGEKRIAVVYDYNDSLLALDVPENDAFNDFTFKRISDTPMEINVAADE